MQQNTLLLDSSPWLILLCIAFGLAYGFLLYSGKHPWSKSTNIALLGLRSLLIAVIAFLLLEPIFKNTSNSRIQPNIVFAIDNSQSVKAASDSVMLGNLLSDIQNMASELESNGYRVHFASLDSSRANLSAFHFDKASTPLHRTLQGLDEDFYRRNLSGVVLVSDGIVNRGMSPIYGQYSFPVHTVGLGDTATRKDIVLQQLNYNKLAYEGNNFPLIAEISQEGFAGQEVNVAVIHQGRSVAAKSITLPEDNTMVAVNFELEARAAGWQQYEVRVQVLEEEFTSENNSRTAYIEIAEGKEKVLLIAAAPHPDIKAIRSAIESSNTMALEVYIPGLQEPESEEHALVILHGLPDAYQTQLSAFDKYLSGRPRLFIVNQNTNISAFNSQNNILTVQLRQQKKDMVFPGFNQDFRLFGIDESLTGRLPRLSPVAVPFANYNIKGNAVPLLRQRVGNITTDKPLWVLEQSGEQKTGVIVAEGLWQWRLQENAKFESQEAFNQLILKTVRFLSNTDDKSRFIVTPLQREINSQEQLVLQTEVYNEIYEPLYGQDVQLTLQHEDGELKNYNYRHTQVQRRFSIDNLRPGSYTFTATTTLGGQSLSSQGQFSVQELMLEMLDLKANHNLLRQIATQQKGNFYLPEELQQLQDDLLNQNTPDVLHSSESFRPLVNAPLLFVLIMIAIGTEWFFRKYLGKY